MNLMTLGGLALAVGILVDDATVEIENIHRNLAMKKPMVRAILDGASQIAVPAFVSTLCICIVFVPIFFLSGTARFLFQPLAMAVIFAMLASYLLSRTVVPTMVRFLLRGHLDEIDTSLAQSVEESDGGQEKIANRSRENPTAPGLSALARIFGFLCWIHEKFNHVFEKLRARCVNALRWCLEHRRVVFAGMGAMVLVSFALVPFLGRDFFSAVDAGQFRLHLRASAVTRLESTQERSLHVRDAIL